jgi:hypothetical protein
MRLVRSAALALFEKRVEPPRLHISTDGKFARAGEALRMASGATSELDASLRKRSSRSRPQMVKRLWHAIGCALLVAGAALLETGHNAGFAWSLIVCGAALVVTDVTRDDGPTRG